MSIQDILSRIGLTPNQAMVYERLLEFGSGTVSTISKRTGLHRPAIYKDLPALQEMGLISLVPKGKQKWYAAEPPIKLQRLVENFTNAFNQVLPDIERAYAFSGNKPIIKFFEGRKGVISVFEDLLHTLKRGDVFYRYSTLKELKEGERYLPKNYREIRDQKQLQSFVITNESIQKNTKPRLERSMKVVQKKYGLFDYGITQLIYANKVSFIDYNTETALIIENSHIAEFQTKLFRMLFDLLP